MGFLTKGKEKEKLFGSLFNKTTFSDEKTDINEHWDLKIEYKVDVKSLKKINRTDVYTNEFYHFIELKNVHGKLGWLYGEADFFSFETNQYWIIVSKESLQNLVKEKVTKILVNNTDEALYCLYSRDGRSDVITLVKTLDLMFIATEVIEKVADIIENMPGDSIIPEKNIQKKIKALLSKKE